MYPGHRHRYSFSDLVSASDFQRSGTGAGGLPKLERSGLPADLSGVLRHSPPFGDFSAESGVNSVAYGNINTGTPYFLHHHSTIRSESDSLAPSLQHVFSGMAISEARIENDNSFGSMFQWFEDQMSLANTHDAINGPPPSPISTESPSGVNELILE